MSQKFISRAAWNLRNLRCARSTGISSSRFFSATTDGFGSDKDMADLAELSKAFQQNETQNLQASSNSNDQEKETDLSAELDALNKEFESSDQTSDTFSFDDGQGGFEDIQFGDSSFFDDQDSVKKDDYADFLDRTNPPKLTREHYRMLKDVAIIQLSDAEKQQYEEAEIEERKKEALVWEDKFGISRDMYDAYLSNFPNNDEHLDFKAKELPNKGYDFSREPGRTFDPRDFAALEQVPLWKPVPRGRMPGQCRFCDDDLTPDREDQITYTNVELLYKYINERGMISMRRNNLNCAKHQRKIAIAIKQAREIGLMPYISNWRIPMAGDYSADDFNDPETRDYYEQQEQAALLLKQQNPLEVLEADDGDAEQEFVGPKY